MSYVVQFDLHLAEKLREDLESSGGFSFSKPPYTIFQAKKSGLSCTLYESGKLVVQGKGTKEFVEFYLEPELLHSFTFGYEMQKQDLRPHIGVDESGKGDFFGPLCIAGVYADESTIPELSKLGVKDSKKLQDSTIRKLAKELKQKYIYHVVCINPKRYNELYASFGNLNSLLGWGHATVIDNLLEKTSCNLVVIDKFANESVVERAVSRKKKEVQIIQKTGGESDLVVAAASILARAAFVEGLDSLEKLVDHKLPKGANSKIVDIGKELVKKHGDSILATVGKMHFKTAQEILSQI